MAAAVEDWNLDPPAALPDSLEVLVPPTIVDDMLPAAPWFVDVAAPLLTALHLAYRLEFMAEKEVLRFFCPEPDALAAKPADSAWLPPITDLRCWNFSLIVDSLDW